MKTLDEVKIAPQDTSVEELDAMLRIGYRSIVQQTDDWRPLAQHIHNLMKASYAAGKRDAGTHIT